MPTVPTETSSQDFTGNGIAVDFPIPFPILETSDIVVELTLEGETTPTLQVEGVDYTVDAAPSAAPTVTMTDPPPDLSTLHVERTVPITQLVNLLTAGPFSPSTHTRALDLLTMVCQQLARRIAELEAAANLVSLATFDAQMVTLEFTANAADVETTFAGGALTVAVVLGAGETLTGVAVVRVVSAGDVALEAIQVRDWTWAANVLTIVFITGLEPGVSYTLSLLCTSMVP